MKLDEIVAWYQKKIGTYDEQQWEKTVERKILDGFNNRVALKNAKLKTELIDVDLVRGSTFPKAKSKQSLLTVIRLAILRYLFLPLYAKWWAQQTSPKIFCAILMLYLTELLNWAIYMYNVNHIDAGTFVKATLNGNLSRSDGITVPQTQQLDQLDEHIVSLAELLIPMALGLLISLIHSQIVATNGVPSNKNKRRRYSNPNINGISKPLRNELRIRKRKKVVRIRQELDLSPNITNSMHALYAGKKQVNGSNNSNSIMPTTSKNQEILLKSNTPKCSRPLPTTLICTNSEEIYLTTTSIKALYPQSKVQEEIPSIKKADTNQSFDTQCVKYNDCDSMDSPMKKRNVNWDSPLHKYVKIESTDYNVPSQIKSTVTQSPTSSVSSTSLSIQASTNNTSETSTSANDNEATRTKDNEIQTSVTTFKMQPTTFNVRHNIVEDDGFESLNGKSSSGEDTQSPRPTIITDVPQLNELRLRINVNGAGATVTNEKKSQLRTENSSDATDEEGDDEDIMSNSASVCNNECTTSATEWLGITTNSEDCSCSSELEQSDELKTRAISDEDNFDIDFTPTTILNSHSNTDRISCTIWDREEIKKATMSVLEISSCIIDRVESMAETHDYIYIGLCFSFLLSFVPVFCRLCEVTIDGEKNQEISYFDLPMMLWEKSSFSFFRIFLFAFGNTYWERAVLMIGFFQRLCLTLIIFIIFAVAERTFKQRFLYAKLFSHLTSSRRARKSNLPHFRLNKVRNIKTWLSVRSYLKKRGPQRSVDIIVSAAFIVTLLLLAFLSVEWLKDSVHLHSQLNLEALMWSITIGIFLLRFMTLGNKIHHKYRSVSVLITEQINLYLQIEQKPKKKEELMVSNSVLKLASDLLKELETPFKISGLSANPYLFTTIKVVILSALSGVLSEVLGFKLKLHKIKIK